MPIDWGIKVTKAGDSVHTVTDQNSVFSTKFSTLKVYLWGDISVTTNGSGNGSNSVTHGLGFAPAFLCFRKGTAQFTFLDASSYTNSFLPDPGIYNNWISNQEKFSCYTDSTKLYIDATGAAASTTYNFRYYILVDLAQDFSGADAVTHQKDFGIKISKTGKDVHTAKEYDLVYSSLYKTLQYYDESYKTFDMTLPAMWASPIDQDVQEGTYVDINHGLGYPPLFLAFFKDSTLANTTVPFADKGSTTPTIRSVDGFCDSTRIRLSFYRRSVWLNAPSPQWASATVTVKVYVFTEDLTAT